MKQYKYTSADFVPQNSHIPDAYIESTELDRIKSLAGVSKPKLVEYTTNDIAPGVNSPVGTAGRTIDEKKKIEKNLNIKTGTPEWFRLWFAKPELTGEKPIGDEGPETKKNPGSLLDKEGHADLRAVSQLSKELDNNNQAANESKPKY